MLRPSTQANPPSRSSTSVTERPDGTAVFDTLADPRPAEWYNSWPACTAFFCALMAGAWFGTAPGNRYISCNFWLIVIGMGPATTIIHELGHWYAARWLGGRTYGIAIGRGPRWLRFTAFGIPFEIRRACGGGLMYYRWTDYSRWQLAVIILAGGLANLLLAAALFLVFRAELLHVRPWATEMQWIGSFAAANLVSGIFGGFGQVSRNPEFLNGSDCQNLFRLLFGWRRVVPSMAVHRFLNQGIDAFNLRDFATAVKQFEEALALDPDLVRWNNSRFAPSDLPSGVRAMLTSLLFERRFGEAATLLSKAHLRWPSIQIFAKYPIDQIVADSIDMLGRERLQHREFAEAVLLFEAARSYLANTPRSRFNLGVALLSIERLEEAIELFRDLDNDPALTDEVRQHLPDALKECESRLLFRQGMEYLRTERWSDALAEFDLFMEQNDRWAFANQKGAAANRAACLCFLERFEDAANYCREMLLDAQLPAPMKALFQANLAYAYLFLGEPYLEQEACQLAEAAAKALASNPACRLIHASALIANGSYAAGTSIIRELLPTLETPRAQANANASLALAAYRTGDPAEARELAQRAHTLCSNAAVLRQLIERVPELAPVA